MKNQGKMGSRVKLSSPEEMAKHLRDLTKQDAKAFLKGHHLMKPCSKDRPEQHPKLGELVWARNLGSPYWPSFIAEVKDTDAATDEDGIDDTAYTFVIFLEETFRYAPIPWENIIPMQDVHIQRVMVNAFNKIQYKGKGTNSFTKKAVDLLDKFLEIPAADRNKVAVVEYEKILRNKKRSSDGSSNRKKSESVEEPPPPEQVKEKYKEKINQMVSETKKKKKSGLRVSDRIVTKQVVQLKNESKTVTAKKKTDKPEDEKPKTKPVNKNARPDTGGEVLKQWTKNTFDQLTKTYTFESNSPPPCLSCNELIENPDDIKYCHGLPHHYNCLEEVNGSNDAPIRKCSMCIAQVCFICREKPVDKPAHKCSRCDLRFHIDCLQDWPQAEIQGSNGPITCPAHFCHTCLGEQKAHGKFRDYTTNPSKAYHCLECLSTYHKTCLPAGCGEDIKGKEFIICPKHKLPKLNFTQRRIGCLTCFKPLKAKEQPRMECQFCAQVFHPECCGYTGEVKEKVSLADFAKDYKCFPCKWGLFPLYGQVVWFQQPGSQYWPARILFPVEMNRRTEFAKRLPGEYSVEYFGSTSLYDHANRATPLHLTTLDVFKRMGIYQDTGKILRAHEEASFFLQFLEAYRDKMLPAPRPVYKKIDKNVYRAVFVSKAKKEQTDKCSCADDSKADFVCLPDSGCSNRDMEMECSDKICKGGKRCTNRMFVERKNDDEFLEQRLFPNKGWGVIAKKVFQPGDFIAEYRGEVIDRTEMMWRLGKKEEEDPMYILEISKEFFIDAEYIGNLSRLINHSCDPNCEIRKYMSQGRNVGGIFAKRQIQIGEEVTFNYGCGSQSTAAFRCRCGASKCVVFVGKDVPEGFQVEEEADHAVDKWDDVCAICHYGGRVICCEFPGCGKVYHWKCVGITRQPSNSWYCPDHPEKDKKMQQLRSIRKSNGKMKNVKQKVMNGSISSSKSGSSRSSSSASSVVSIGAGRKRKLSAASVVQNSIAKLSESVLRKNGKRKLSTEAEKAHSEPPQKRRKSPDSDSAIEIASTPSDTNSSNSVTSTPRTSRRLRSTTATPQHNGEKSDDGDGIIHLSGTSSVMTCSEAMKQLKNAPVVTTDGRRRSTGSFHPTRSLRQRNVRRETITIDLTSSTDDSSDVPTTRSQSVNSTPSGGSSRRSKARSGKSTEPFSPLALNTFIKGLNNTSDGENSADNDGSIKPANKSPEAAVESQSFCLSAPTNGMTKEAAMVTSMIQRDGQLRSEAPIDLVSCGRNSATNSKDSNSVIDIPVTNPPIAHISKNENDTSDIEIECIYERFRLPGRLRSGQSSASK